MTRSWAVPATPFSRINPGPDPLVIAAAGTNTLDFSVAALAITINLG